MASTAINMELKEVQGLLARGHSELKAASYVLLQITDAEKFPGWLRKKLHWITDGITKHGKIRVNIAFTHQGLLKQGAKEFVEYGFSVEFEHGMASEFRGRVLGDEDDNAMETWKWGGTQTPGIDLVLMVYAFDEDYLQEKLREFALKYEAGGLVEIMTIPASWNPFGKEHFGFKDGIAQPYIEGLSKKGPAHNTVPVGEFVLGYRDAYGKYPPSPLVPMSKDPHGYLHEHPEKKGYKDFGRNGSYMVFRQLIQDVKGFWGQVVRGVDREKGGPGIATVDEYIALAAKMMGRWPNGKPITLSPDKETPYSPGDEDFLFAANDEKGFKCPIGSHIRRANPRDTLPDNKPKSAIRISNRHRILRRGRPWGPPLVDTYDIGEMIAKENDGEERGLNFICFNTNFSRQFEFIQHHWSNNSKYGGLHEDPDPILGIRDSRYQGDTHNFTIEAEPLRRKVIDLHRQVHVRGGAYFFFPGLSALKYLAHLDIPPVNHGK